MEHLAVKEKYQKAIVDIWKKYEHLEALNAAGCDCRKSPFITAFPISFSGVLSGQWVLDLGSLERLMWVRKR